MHILKGHKLVAYAVSVSIALSPLGPQIAMAQSAPRCSDVADFSRSQLDSMFAPTTGLAGDRNDQKTVVSNQISKTNSEKVKRRISDGWNRVNDVMESIRKYESLPKVNTAKDFASHMQTETKWLYWVLKIYNIMRDRIYGDRVDRKAYIESEQFFRAIKSPEGTEAFIKDRRLGTRKVEIALVDYTNMRQRLTELGVDLGQFGELLQSMAAQNKFAVDGNLDNSHGLEIGPQPLRLIDIRQLSKEELIKRYKKTVWTLGREFPAYFEMMQNMAFLSEFASGKKLSEVDIPHRFGRFGIDFAFAIHDANLENTAKALAANPALGDANGNPNSGTGTQTQSVNTTSTNTAGISANSTQLLKTYWVNAQKIMKQFGIGQFFLVLESANLTQQERSLLSQVKTDLRLSQNLPEGIVERLEQISTIKEILDSDIVYLKTRAVQEIVGSTQAILEGSLLKLTTRTMATLVKISKTVVLKAPILNTVRDLLVWAFSWGSESRNLFFYGPEITRIKGIIAARMVNISSEMEIRNLQAPTNDPDFLLNTAIVSLKDELADTFRKHSQSSQRGFFNFMYRSNDGLYEGLRAAFADPAKSYTALVQVMDRAKVEALDALKNDETHLISTENMRSPTVAHTVAIGSLAIVSYLLVNHPEMLQNATHWALTNLETIPGVTFLQSSLNAVNTFLGDFIKAKLSLPADWDPANVVFTSAYGVSWGASQSRQFIESISRAVLSNKGSAINGNYNNSGISNNGSNNNGGNFNNNGNFNNGSNTNGNNNNGYFNNGTNNNGSNNNNNGNNGPRVFGNDGFDDSTNIN